MSDRISLFCVNATFVALIAASALTWALVIVKALQVRRLTRQTQTFVEAFAKFVRLPSAAELTRHEGPAARVALAGAESWQESARGANDKEADLEVRQDLLERSLKQALGREKRSVESGLPVLASVGSTAPFVGLFGTVLGIIHALTAISGAGSASLDVVAGPIGEALIATAIGIAVAVPAVLAYNYFLRKSKTANQDLEEFANLFVGSALKDRFLRADRGQDETRTVKHALELRQEASA
ncbi:MAG TPA: MotA/TolQ/ExbB proton channel family protein [Polyangiales bacterium]